MLPAAARLTSSESFRRCLREGRRSSSRTLVAHLWVPAAVPSTGLSAGTAGSPAGSPARAGFVVSRAVGGAVVRNRVRRRLRHLVRELLHDLPADAMLVVRALPAAAHASYPELTDDLARCLGRALTPNRTVDLT